ncbi:mRNA-capping enzyme [Quillaja saponaria]|uniref:mRNA guanylyltransferase n=1 Tax=Quillaja saponaria TaxID=32244 RepID=A0AAD7Q9Q0_QUISA|nr:mRNA-capping enzyme [Quillaja saponaria]
MDLNSSPLPEQDEERYKRRHGERPARETEERRWDLKRKSPYAAQQNVPPRSMHDQGFHNRNGGSYDRNMLPPGWLDCPAYGQEIGCIIPSKVPLGESFSNYIISERYSPKQAIHQQRLLGRELGLVIDLTNTTRYYPISDWTKEGIGYVKIRCKGRDSVPDNEAVDQFFNEVLQFRSQRTQPKKYILVHCTHGHNRTGYMIVHFLIRTESISVTEAIKKFSTAREPGIYKQEYIDALYLFYHERKPELVVCPQTPEWKRLSDPDFHGAAVPDHGNNGAASFQENLGRSVLTNDDVLGDPVPSYQLQSMRQFCYQVLKMNAGGRGCSQFPGSHPVSLNRDNLQILRQRYYYATWKADGTRYMMLITGDGCYLIDRKYYFRRVLMRFPCKYLNDSEPEKTHHFTLLDGEMIIDTDPHTNKQERRYLIYDLMAINQVSVSELPFGERWKLLEKEVIEPRNMEREALSKSINPYYRYDLEPFSVRRKNFWFLSTVPKLLKKFIPDLSHEADGLIFQGWDDPYVPRTHEGLLKWKYPEMNSVDFLFELGANTRPLLFLYERGRKKLMEGNRVVFKDALDSSSCSGKIIECSWDPEENCWICMRLRLDKSTPNEFNTYKKVMRSIKDNITEDVLLNEIDQIVRLPMYADRIRNDTKAHQHMVSARRK